MLSLLEHLPPSTGLIYFTSAKSKLFFICQNPPQLLGLQGLSSCLCSLKHSLDLAWSVCSLHGGYGGLDPRVPRPWEEPRKVQWSLWPAEPWNSPALWGDIPGARAAETLLHSAPSKTSPPSVVFNSGGSSPSQEASFWSKFVTRGRETQARISLSWTYLEWDSGLALSLYMTFLLLTHYSNIEGI